MPEIVIGRDLEDLKKFGKRATINIGKHLVGSGEEFNLTTPVLLDVLRPHVILICGKRGSGKSYSMGVMIEEIAKLPTELRSKLAIVVIDTQGIFWTMKMPSEYTPLLGEWDLEPRGFDVNVFVPLGQSDLFSKAGVKFDSVFSISPSDLRFEDWMSVFDLDINDPIAVLLNRVVDKLRKKGEYGIEEMVEEIKNIHGFEREKLVLENLITGTKYWGIFGKKGMPPLLEPGKISILDLSLTPRPIRGLLVSFIARKIFEERTLARRQEELTIIEGEEVGEKPICWLFIDEAHNFIPRDENPASLGPLLRIIREGRQPGISLIMAVQQPNKLHEDAISQCDLVISHRITSEEDVKALEAIMQTYILFNIRKYLEELPRIKGVAIVLDDNSERLYKIRVRPRQSWHAGASPSLIHEARG